MLKRIAVLCFLPLLLGGAVYIFFREQGLLGVVLNISYHPGPISLFLINTVPDFCWSFSLASALYLFFRCFHVSFGKAIVFVTLVVVSSEAVQLFFPERFTFDMKDLLAGLLAVFLSTYYFMQTLYEKNKF